MSLESKRKILIEHMLLKIDDSSWRGVVDLAMDLMELEIETEITIKYRDYNRSNKMSSAAYLVEKEADRK